MCGASKTNSGTIVFWEIITAQNYHSFLLILFLCWLYWTGLLVSARQSDGSYCKNKNDFLAWFLPWSYCRVWSRTPRSPRLRPLDSCHWGKTQENCRASDLCCRYWLTNSSKNCKNRFEKGEWFCSRRWKNFQYQQRLKILITFLISWKVEIQIK